MKKFFLLFLIFVTLNSFLVNAIPELPMIISGDIYINDKEAESGTIITMKTNNEIIEEIKTTEKGKFKLLLQKLNEGDEVQIYIEDIQTQENIIYKSGDFKQLTLKVEKHYYSYYLTGGLVALVAILLIWKWKSRKGRSF